MLSNPTFWVLISTAIFVGAAVYMGAAKAVTAAMGKIGGSCMECHEAHR